MPRETLPTGASLLALAGGGQIRAPLLSPSVVEEQASSVAERRILPARQRAAGPPVKEVSEKPGVGPSQVASRKQKVNARVSATLLDEVRDCVVALSGPPHGLTMDGFAEEAYRRELERLSRSFAAGKPFPRRTYNPKPGRRVSWGTSS
jgi:hypothetical protein